MKKLTRTGSIGRLLTVLLALFLYLPALAAEQVTATAVVESQEVYVGETFILQVRVDGNDSPAQPDMSSLETDFAVQYMGGQQNSSSSVSIVNGRMSREVRHGYVFNFNLRAKHEGRLLVPAILIEADGAKYATMSIVMSVKSAEESDDFKLRLDLAQNRVYVGETVGLTVTWYIGKDVKNANFTLPILDSPAFTVRPKEVEGVSRDKLVRVPFAQYEAIGVRGSSLLNGQRVTTLTFSFTMLPKKAGTFVLERGTVSCEYLAGYRQNRSSDRHSGFFDDDFFGRGMLGRNRKVYRTVVVPSNEPQLTVLPLPLKGRPTRFNGLVGDYSLAVSATPVQVKVGDPITLTVQVAGNYIKDVRLPSLREQLGNGFKVPQEMAPAVVDGQLKTFTQTIRVRRPGVKAIPPVNLPFFNVQSGQYETAVSQAIALEVKAVKVVTAQDAEGGAVTVRKNDLQATKGGINYNYEGADVLISNSGTAGSGATVMWYLLLGLPPVFYAALLLNKLFIDQRRNNPQLRAARRAHATFRQALAQLQNVEHVSVTELYGRVSHALRQYLGARMGLKSAAITYNDVEPGLLKMGVAHGALRQLREVLEQCEAVHFSGGAAVGDFSKLATKALDIVQVVEQGINGKG